MSNADMFHAEASLSAIAGRLDQIESALREHSNALSQLRTAHTAAESALTPMHCKIRPITPSVSVLHRPPDLAGTSRISKTVDIPPMTIPLWHSTTTGSLLSCPLVRPLLGDYPSDVFLRIEERRTLPDQLKVTLQSRITPEKPLLNRATTDSLMDVYFQTVNLQHPILSVEDCIAHYHSVVSEPLQASLETGFVLLMLALAEAATMQPPKSLDADWYPGSVYLLPALSIILDAYLNTAIHTPALPQCLYLAALYYNYLARPLDAWKLVHMASTSFQRLWLSDLIEEHHLPRSGIENLVDRLHLPLCGDPPTPSLLAWLAELSARRLLNRYLLQADYVTRDECRGREEGVIIRLMSSSLNVSVELDVQLNNWYDLIPQSIKSDLAQTNLSTRDAMIALCHHSAKDIIFRPFFLFACSFPSDIRLPQPLLEICQTTVYSCSQYIRVAARRFSEPSSSTEIIIHS
ncbi:hypothetical protein BDV27DRAFT_140832 [Aspergillus caelatus]|uniref:Transcription factor domain-containing protein n=1 Tax=Aspergillus caelatus TaxID=61420 RepID=A0A5N7AJQ9_9EURO|nr:uncharacterized protein BDV27DRAFT_140832 [Aspergillus caelatus]KAE8369923.1 hypothetical protein BDV27DRAFT_140832 [Aspergillus caelatus]